MDRERYSITALAEQVNAWCDKHGAEPLHNGASSKVTVRNIRYYQTLGLVDRPVTADGHGFTEKHRLQLIAIRLLQAKGLPLERIQGALSGRTDEELRAMESKGREDATVPLAAQASREIEWKVTPVADDILLLTHSRRELTAAQRLKIQEIVRSEPAQSWEPQFPDLESFRPEID